MNRSASLADTRGLPLNRLLQPVDGAAFSVRFYRTYGKRALDVAGATVLLVLALPVLGITALSVWVALGSPVLYRQPRLGLGANEFTLLKFRTMRPDRRQLKRPWAGHERRTGLPSASDPRRTRLGETLRRWSLDELPQLAQVITGQLSLIGPRPELAGRLSAYSREERQRFSVRPGLTGAWQVSCRHETNDLHAGIEIDLAYVQCRSFTNDLRILALTPHAILFAPAPH